VFFDNGVVLAKPGKSPMLLTMGQLAALEGSRILDARTVDDVEVREDKLSGQARLRLRTGEKLVLSWWVAIGNRGVEVENLLSAVFVGNVEQAPADPGARVLKVGATFALAGALFAGASMGVRALTHDAPPPPPPAAPPVTLSPNEQVVRNELSAVCPPWVDFVSKVPRGDRPDPIALRPIVDALRPRFGNAAGVIPAYAEARDEVEYLQGFSRKPVDEVNRESVSRVAYAMDSITKACAGPA
jgi:hypothetical protein